MSDEIHMEAAWRHRDMTLTEQWHGRQPDEDLMEKEDEGACSSLSARVALMDRLMVYLFSGDDISIWQNVALRAHAILLHCAPHLLVRRSQAELAVLKRQAGVNREDSLRAATDLLRTEPEAREALARLIAYVYPGDGKRWLFRGTQRAYILARAYQPWLVCKEGKELSYEDLAVIFEGGPLTTPKARNRARSRWSARAQEVVRKPIEAAGGVARMQFSKSAMARKRMEESAKGNGNRRNEKSPDVGATE